jgi:hypothetical protein
MGHHGRRKKPAKSQVAVQLKVGGFHLLNERITELLAYLRRNGVTGRISFALDGSAL